MIYENGKMYVIFSNSKKLFYIGSTTQTLIQRLAQHNTEFKRFKLGKSKYTSSFEVLACDDYQIKLIEDCPCSNNRQLERREGELIKTYTMDGFEIVNRNVAGRTLQEYKLDNAVKIKEYHKEYQKEYRSEHGEEIKQYQKEYRSEHGDKIKEHNKEYYADNKQAILEQRKDYYKTNKQAILVKIKDYYKTNKQAILKQAKERYAAKKNQPTEEI